MLGFKQLQLSDKEILDRHLKAVPNRNSDCNFTNLYMWRLSYAVRWAVLEDHLIIEPDAYEGRYILPPYGVDSDDAAFSKAIVHLAKAYKEEEKPFVIRGITESERARLKRLFPGRFAYYEEPSIADYIYTGEALRSLKGRKYSKKRGHLNAFFKDWPDFQYEEMGADNVEEVIDFLERWYGARNLTDTLDSSLLAERAAIFDALKAYSTLEYVAGYIRLNGRIMAFTMGEQIAEDTVVIHVEKAFDEIRGLYQAINQLYLQHQWPDIAFVNREEDMGLEGLRKAKESYYPVTRVYKYTGVWIDD